MLVARIVAIVGMGCVASGCCFFGLGDCQSPPPVYDLPTPPFVKLSPPVAADPRINRLVGAVVDATSTTLLNSNVFVPLSWECIALPTQSTGTNPYVASIGRQQYTIDVSGSTDISLPLKTVSIALDTSVVRKIVVTTDNTFQETVLEPALNTTSANCQFSPSQIRDDRFIRSAFAATNFSYTLFDAAGVKIDLSAQPGAIKAVTPAASSPPAATPVAAIPAAAAPGTGSPPAATPVAETPAAAAPGIGSPPAATPVATTPAAAPAGAGAGPPVAATPAATPPGTGGPHATTPAAATPAPAPTGASAATSAASNSVSAPTCSAASDNNSAATSTGNSGVASLNANLNDDGSLCYTSPPGQAVYFALLPDTLSNTVNQYVANVPLGSGFDDFPFETNNFQYQINSSSSGKYLMQIHAERNGTSSANSLTLIAGAGEPLTLTQNGRACTFVVVFNPVVGDPTHVQGSFVLTSCQ
jgi:hypothetical protein